MATTEVDRAMRFMLADALTHMGCPMTVDPLAPVSQTREQWDMVKAWVVHLKPHVPSAAKERQKAWLMMYSLFVEHENPAAEALDTMLDSERERIANGITAWGRKRDLSAMHGDEPGLLRALVADVRNGVGPFERPEV